MITEEGKNRSLRTAITGAILTIAGLRYVTALVRLLPGEEPSRLFPVRWHLVVRPTGVAEITRFFYVHGDP
jgi:hypothetical protein